MACLLAGVMAAMLDIAMAEKRGAHSVVQSVASSADWTVGYYEERKSMRRKLKKKMKI